MTVILGRPDLLSQTVAGDDDGDVGGHRLTVQRYLHPGCLGRWRRAVAMAVGPMSRRRPALSSKSGLLSSASPTLLGCLLPARLALFLFPLKQVPIQKRPLAEERR